MGEELSAFPGTALFSTLGGMATAEGVGAVMCMSCRHCVLSAPPWPTQVVHEVALDRA